jgi:hypothetical protein
VEAPQIAPTESRVCRRHSASACVCQAALVLAVGAGGEVVGAEVVGAEAGTAAVARGAEAVVGAGEAGTAAGTAAVRVGAQEAVAPVADSANRSAVS